MSAIIIIPARHGSTRFPGKPLALLKGRPLIQHVYQNSLGSLLADDVMVATDNEEILKKVMSFGGKAVMTSCNHISGTDRIAEVARSLNYDIIVNVQGDEPLIRPEMIDNVISVLDDSRASIGTLARRITDERDIFDPNVVKVIFDSDGFAFYFSRAPVPYHRDLFSPGAQRRRSQGAVSIPPDPCELQGFRASDLFMYKHIGIYSYRRDVLLRLSGAHPSRFELIERLEQLRALANNFKIKIKETSSETFGVDTPEDLERIEKCLNLSL